MNDLEIEDLERQETRARYEDPGLENELVTLGEYQRASRLTAIYPGHGTGSHEALAYVALGLGEVGELQGKVKKIHRDGTRDDAAMAAELGDILWYISQFSLEIGIPLEKIARDNLEKLFSRQERGVIGGSGDNR